MAGEVWHALLLIAEGIRKMSQLRVSRLLCKSRVAATWFAGLPAAYFLATFSPRTARMGTWAAPNLAALPTVVIGFSLYFRVICQRPPGLDEIAVHAHSDGNGAVRVGAAVAIDGGSQRTPPTALIGLRNARYARRPMSARMTPGCCGRSRSAIVAGTVLAFSRAFTELGAAF